MADQVRWLAEGIAVHLANDNVTGAAEWFVTWLLLLVGVI